MLPFLILGMVAGELFLRPSKAAETATALKGAVDEALAPAPVVKEVMGFQAALTSWEEIDCWHSGLEALRRQGGEDMDQIMVQQWIAAYARTIRNGADGGIPVVLGDWPARDREQVIQMCLLLIKKGFK